MKLKQTLLITLLLVFVSSGAQTAKLFAGKQNETDPTLNRNDATCDKADVYFYYPFGITWDKSGNMWITERNKIRLFYNDKFYNRAGKLGDGSMSQSYKNGTGNQAYFYSPSGIASNSSGDLFIADDENHAIRKMVAFTSTGQGQTVTTFAGQLPDGNFFGTPGSTNGTGTNASFFNPRGMVMDASGNLYIAEFNNFCIRKVTSGGLVSTLAGNITVQGTKDGTGSGAEFGGPYGIAELDNNYLIVSDFDNGLIRKVHKTTGAVTTLCGKAGENLIADGDFSSARFREPRGLAVADGKIYVCDASTLRVIDINNQTVSTFAGDKNSSGNVDGVGANAKFGILGGIAYDGKIGLYVTDLYYNVIRLVTIDDLAPVVDFTASKTAAIIDEKITFTNTSGGKPSTSMVWTITPASHSVASGSLTSSPVDIKFQVAGFYNVNLEVTNSFGTNQKYKGSFISVSTTGISVIPENVNIGVYPNPSSGQFNMQSLYGNYPIESYEIYDLNGKKVLSKICNKTSKETISMDSFNDGIYLLKVKTSETYHSLRIIKKS
ncbi:MAG: T9SS type A sorting domain-containing protein [Flavobacteriales bacterium]|nr:T9SS type A sorting domain-containing protein [Flavobacteriales bacterium]